MTFNSTIHALELIFFDSNTQETAKKQLYPSDSSNFPPSPNVWRFKRSHLFLTFITRKNDVTPSNIKEICRWKGGLHKTAPNCVMHFRPNNYCRIKHDFYYWLYRRGVLESATIHCQNFDNRKFNVSTIKFTRLIIKSFKGFVSASIVFDLYLQIKDVVKETQYLVFEKGAEMY